MSKYESYRSALLQHGFLEATHESGHFIRKTTDYTAFVINLEESDECVWILYGFTTIPNTDDAWRWYEKNGESENTCKLRTSLVIITDEDKQVAKDIIHTFYQTWSQTEKDALIAAAKEKQKAFLNRFAIALKPLGFKKKATTWSRPLNGGLNLMFQAQKSAYSDQYYFNTYICCDLQEYYKFHYFTRIAPYGSDIYNWQLMSDEQIDYLIEYTVNKVLVPLIQKYDIAKSI